MDRRVLVTGASGFLGRHVVPALLARGYDVHTVGRRRPAEAGIQHHFADLLAWDGARETLAASRPDVLVHLAWAVEHGRFWTAPENLDWVAASLRLARAAAEASVARFVGVGTCMEYDWSHEPGRPRREDDPLAASSLYAEAKIATFRLLDRFCREAGMSFAWGRVFHPFGPGEPAEKLVPAIARAVRAGEAVTLRNGGSQRDFIAAPDVGSALAALALSAVAGPVNIASGEVVAIEALARLVQQIAGGGGMIASGAGGASGEPGTMSADVTRLRHEVGVSAPPPLQARLAELLGAEA